MTKRDVKKGISADDSRRRREENTIKLRKEKKEEGLAKRRNIQALLESEPDVAAAQSSAGNVSNIPLSADPQSMALLHKQLVGGDLAQQVIALRSFRRLLSIEKNPPVQQCVDLGVVPIFVQCLHRNDCQDLQFEAAWALTNIASTDRTQLIVDYNAVGPLVQLLSSSNPDIREQSAWCLGNVAGDSTALRDLVLSHGALPPLLANLAQPHSLSLLRNCTWTLSNLCRGKPQPRLEMIQSAMPALAHLVKSEDQDTKIDAAWAISYITDGNDDRIQPMIDLGVLPTLLQMMSSDITTMVVPALRALGNMVSGNDLQTQAVVDAGALPVLLPLLSHMKKNIRKETCWVISNIAAGTPVQLNSLFQLPNLLPQVIEQLRVGEWDVRREACWVISNVATSGSPDHLKHIVELGVLGPLSELLGQADVKIITTSLDAIEAVLKSGEKTGQLEHLIQLMNECGGIEALENLQEHQNAKIYNRALSLLETFFEEEEEEGENTAPATNGNQFTFGLQAPINPKQHGFIVSGGQPVNTHQHFSF